MSELRDIYIVKIDPNRTGYDYLCTDYRVNTDQVRYTPHAKLQEAYDQSHDLLNKLQAAINELVKANERIKELETAILFHDSLIRSINHE